MVINNNIIIAGADGFIGNSLNCSLSGKFNITSIGNYDRGLGLSYFGDLSEKVVAEQIAQECPSSDILIFLVGLAHKKGKGAEYEMFEKTNFQTLVELLEALESQKKLPKIIIFASTVSVYGERKKVSVYDENTDTMPFSPYALTKLKAEEYLLKNYKERSWVLRFAPVYSKDFRLNIDRRTAIGRFNYKVGNGEQRLSLCNLKNVDYAVSGIVNGEVPFGTYNISDEMDYSYNTLLESIRTENIIRVPKFIPYFAYYLGAVSKNIFIRENSLKLIKDNVFPSKKIRKYIDLPYNMGNLKN